MACPQDLGESSMMRRQQRTSIHKPVHHDLKRGELEALTQALEGTTIKLEAPPSTQPKIDNVIAHLGLGNFCRSHLFYVTDRLVRTHPDDAWGITMVGFRPNDVKKKNMLKKQDMMYTLVMEDEEESKARIIEAMNDYVVVHEESKAYEALCVDPRLKIISLTVTEKGYFQDVMTGRLDLKAKAIAGDIAAWGPAGLDKPQTAFGFVCSVLQRRKNAGLPPVTVMSCDNLPLNGNLVRGSVGAFAKAVDGSLSKWIDDNVKFPNSMVDRITPATTAENTQALADNFGVVDAWPVPSERFFQWVVEDKFAVGRPDWHKAFERDNANESVLLTDDVEPYETMKLRLLNSGHSTLAAVALQLGHRAVHLSLKDPDVHDFLAKYMAQVADTLHPVPGVNIPCYRAQLLTRFGNAKIVDQLARLAQDGSGKYNTTLKDALLDKKSKECMPDFIVTSLACFQMQCAAQIDELGASYDLVDARKGELAPFAKASINGDEVGCKNFLDSVFGPEVAGWDALVTRIIQRHGQIKASGVRSVLRGAVLHGAPAKAAPTAATTTGQGCSVQ